MRIILVILYALLFTTTLSQSAEVPNNSNNIHIDYSFNSYELSKEDKIILDDFANEYRERGKKLRYEYNIFIEAYNCKSELSVNKFIGVQRALVILNYLTSECGMKRYHFKIADYSAVNSDSCYIGYINIISYIDMNRKLIDEW
jgi:outer membrane protein OmpA-like peptidoglycan-associated protein